MQRERRTTRRCDDPSLGIKIPTLSRISSEIHVFLEMLSKAVLFNVRVRHNTRGPLLLVVQCGLGPISRCDGYGCRSASTSEKQHGHFYVDDVPRDRILDHRIPVNILISEADDARRFTNSVERVLVNLAQLRYRFADH